MSFLGALFGGGPQITQATQNQGVQNANQQAQQDIGQQQAFTNALAAQNGIQNQESVFNQLQNVANGQGPNPAQAMLAQSTGQNVANQAALMAGQRGANANVGLLARQAAQQGAATQQQAVGQGAVMQANQSLNALGQLQNLAGNQVAQEQGGLSNLYGMQSGQANMLANQIQSQNQANTSAYNAQQQASLGAFGALSGVGSAIGQGIAAMAEGGAAGAANSQNQGAALKENYKKSKKFIEHFADGGHVKDMKTGGHVPGRAAVGGAKNSYKNDTVPAMLSAGEIVLPRSVTKSANPGEAAKRFVEAINKKKSKK